jgi:hypothetical protein
MKRLCLVLLAFALLAQDGRAAATLSTKVKVDLSGTILENDLGATVATAPLGAPVWTVALGSGTGADKADQLYALKGQSSGSGATLSLDLQGALTDPFGSAFTPSRLRVVYVYSRPKNSTALTLFGDVKGVPILDASESTATLNPGGMFLLVDRSAAGISVTATTADIVAITNASGAAALVDIVLVGASS